MFLRILFPSSLCSKSHNKEIKKSGLEKGEDFIKEESKENIKENIKEEIIEIENKSKSNVADGIKKNNKEHKIYIYVIAAFISCMFNAMSGLMDKILTKDITSSQLQFWYMLFLLLYYVIYCIVTREKVSVKTFKNGWVWILALLFVLADRALFIANGDVNSKVTVMTMIKQSSCIVTILGGKFVFKEKHVGYKILCAVIVVAGIIIAVL